MAPKEDLSVLSAAKALEAKVAEEQRRLAFAEVEGFWERWFAGSKKEGQSVDKNVMKEAATSFVKAGLMIVQDSVGLQSFFTCRTFRAGLAFQCQPELC